MTFEVPPERGGPAVDFVVRSDAPRKRGGDDLQVEEYARALIEQGLDVRIVPFHPSMRLRSHAILHVINVDRPFEFLETCRRRHGRLIVTPIHHDPSGVRAMRASERGRGLRSFVDRLLPFTLRELLVACARALMMTTASSWNDVVAFVARSIINAAGLPARVGAVLDSADAVALLAEGEGRVLRTTTGWASSNDVLIPNGVPETSGVAPVPWHERRHAMIVVGRIEPRKRQLDLVRIAHSRRLDLVVVGELQNPDSRFGRAFLRAVEEAPTVDYLGGLPRTETLRRMASSRVLVNASWVEVQSLVDIEAAALGCFVAATPAGHSQEWLGEAVHTTKDTHDLAALIDLATSLAGSPTPPPPLGYRRTWRQAAADLSAIYDSPGSVR